MNYGKKYLALALALLMVFSILPVSAFAEDVEFIPEEIEEILPVEEVVEEVAAVEEAVPEEEVVFEEALVEVDALEATVTTNKPAVTYYVNVDDASEVTVSPEPDEDVTYDEDDNVVAWIEHEDGLPVTTKTLTREHYTLTGWRDLNGQVYKTTGVTVPNGANLFAIWEGEPVKLTYNLINPAAENEHDQGGTTANAAQAPHYTKHDPQAATVETAWKYGDDVALWTTPTQVGFDFLAWFDADGNFYYFDGESFYADYDYLTGEFLDPYEEIIIEADLELTALWVPKQYEVRFYLTEDDNTPIQSDVVDYWTAIELFTPERAPEDVKITVWLDKNCPEQLVLQPNRLTVNRHTEYRFEHWITDDGKTFRGADSAGQVFDSYKAEDYLNIYGVWSVAEGFPEYDVSEADDLPAEITRKGYNGDIGDNGAFLGWSTMPITEVTLTKEQLIAKYGPKTFVEDYAMDETYPTKYNPSQDLEPGQTEITLYAIWKADEFEVVYVPGTAVKLADIVNSPIVATPVDEEWGAVVDGITINPESIRVDDGWGLQTKFYNIDLDLIGTAVWKVAAEKYTVNLTYNTIDRWSHYTGKDSESFTKNETVDTEFLGWNQQPHPGQTPRDDYDSWTKAYKPFEDTVYTKNEDLVLIPRFDFTINKVELMPNDLGTPDAPKGYVFLGWTYTEAEAKKGPDAKLITDWPIVVDEDNPYVEDYTLDLFAVWGSDELYTIRYHLDEEDITDDVRAMFPDQHKEAGKGVKLWWGPEREGYLFRGWATKPNSTWIVYTENDEQMLWYTDDADMDLYPVWRENTYVVTYDENLPDGETLVAATMPVPNPQTAKFTAGLNISSAEPKVTSGGWEFLGWSTQEDPKGGYVVEYEAGGKYEWPTLEDLDLPVNDPEAKYEFTLYAVWQRETHDILYHVVNDGSDKGNEFAKQMKTYGIAVTLISDQPQYKVVDGKAFYFIGWSCPKTTAVVEYLPSDEFDRDDVSDLYAVWAEADYAITYDANGGEGAPLGQGKFKDLPVKLSTEIPDRADGSEEIAVTLDLQDGSEPEVLAATKSGSYTFDSWNTAKDGSGDEYAPGADYTANESVVLYAQWNSSRPVTTAVTLPTPSREGYAFIEWNTAADGTGTSVARGSYTPTGAITLYAIWVKTSPDEPVYPNEKIKGFVERCYTKALAREADPEGLPYWYHVIEDGQLTAEQVGTYFVFSPEGAQKGQDTKDFLTMLYRLYMDREPEAEGLAYWTEILDNGTLTREQVNDYFGASPEFQAIKAEYGLAAK